MKRTLAACVVALSACALAQADSTKAKKPQLVMTVFAVTGEAENGGSCATPTTLPDPPLAVESEADRARLAAFFGGSEVEFIGSALGRTGEDSRIDAVARIGKSRVYAGARALGDDNGLHSGSLTLQSFGTAQPLDSETFPLGPDATTWIAHDVPGEKHTCIVARITTGEVRQLPAGFGKPRPSIVAGKVEPPRLKKRVEPAAPKGRTGRMVVQSTIDRAGLVQFLTVLSYPPGGDDLVAAGLAAISQWSYEPARQDGEPLDVYFTIQLTFKAEQR